MKIRTKNCLAVCLLILMSVILFGCDDSAITHKHSFKEISRTATCTESGEILYSCDCGETKKEALSAAGHSMTEVSRVDATCTSDGSVSSSCKNCGYKTTEVLEKLGHVLSTQTVPATCTSEGSKTESCAVCDYKSAETLEKLEHELSSVTVDSTCSKAGSVTTTCSACDYKTVKKLKKLAHDLSSVTVPATCTAEGSVTRTCSSCDYKSVETLELIEHELVSSRVEPTCASEGSVTATCSKCDHQEVEVLEKLEHTLSSVTVESTCQTEGSVTTTCSECTYQTVEPLQLADHAYEEYYRAEASCAYPETVVYLCTVCSDMKEEEIGEALDHLFDENFDKPLTYLQPCIREGCTYATLQPQALENMQSFIKSIEYKGISDDFSEKLNTAYGSLEYILETAGAYDPALHGYDAGSVLVGEEARFTAYLQELYDCYYDAVVMYQYAMIQKDIVVSDPELFENYVFLAGYANSIFSLYSGYFQRAYDSALREYFYLGMTPQEIDDVLASYSGYSDPEYVELATYRSELEAEIALLSSNMVGDTPEVYVTDRILDVYSEYVATNNRISEILGGTNPDGSPVYPNGLYYSYLNNYGREYTPDDAQDIYEDIIQYIVPLYAQYAMKLYEIENSIVSSWTDADIEEYFKLTGSYLINADANKNVNDFLSQISYSFYGDNVTYLEAWIDMMENGTLVIGEYYGAYTSYIYGIQRPIIYLGNYDYTLSSNTFVHEFGHYMNYLLREQLGNPETSFDLAETHSQGLEMLYLTYLMKQCGDPELEKVYEYIYVCDIVDRLGVILSEISVDRFERAVYSNYYDGPGADVIMADGNITKDEYDLLYSYITEGELGISFAVPYWRVNADRFGYNISYSVSLLGSLQMLSAPEDFEDRAECYAKLIKFLEEDDWYTYTYKDVLEYAGLYSYDDEKLYEYLYDLLALQSVQ